LIMEPPDFFVFFLNRLFFYCSLIREEYARFMLKISGILFFASLSFSCAADTSGEGLIKTGADQPDKYMPVLKDKRAGLVVNHSSLKGQMHLVDFLLEQDIDVSIIFSPEHGFRGNIQAGEEIGDCTYENTGIPVISLYGKNRKPLPSQLAEIDIMVYDIQDVGCRFYTYISTLHLVMEACKENGIKLMVLDRPNPNGDYVAGPVLDPEFRSFVGMHPIPVVHGCTVGELAGMINNEFMGESGKRCELTVIPVKNYSHEMQYSLPVKPSPNLPNDLSIRLYPSLCFFEATSVSVGRGTDCPFQVIGAPNPAFGDFSFIPRDIPGEAVNPLNENKVCYGTDLRQLKEIPKFTLKYFIDFYKKYESEKDFLIREEWFNLLAGNDKLIKKIREGYSVSELEESWKPALEKYKKLRKKYLLYPDFE
jgi:uncharacterized protein YbbC (DUF1343 family)